jgi:hypothetical protein
MMDLPTKTLQVLTDSRLYSADHVTVGSWNYASNIISYAVRLVSPDVGQDVTIFQNLDMTTGKVTTVFDEREEGLYLRLSAPQLSPDGQKILFSTKIAEIREIFLLDLKSGAIQPVTSSQNEFGFSAPVWNPAGNSFFTSLVFVEGENYQPIPTLFSLDGQVLYQLPAQFSGWVYQWMPGSLSSPTLTPFPTEVSTAESEMVPTPIAFTESRESATLRQQMLFSHTTWDSLWGDAEIIWYPPNNSDKAPQIYRSQLWITLPGLVRILFGPSDGMPSKMWISDNQNYRDFDGLISPLPYSITEPFTPPTEISDIIYPHPLGMLLGSPMSDLIFSTGIAQAGGEFTLTGKELFADRETLVAVWKRSPGTPVIQRIWVDAQTGIVLREQDFSEDGNTLISERYFTKLLSNLQFSESIFNLEAPLPDKFSENPDDN